MRTTFYFAVILASAGIWSCHPGQDQVIMTVNGPVPASEMGITLTHEHILVDFIGADSTGYHRWDRTGVVEKVLPYLDEIREYQVSTLVECTPAYIGRDPWLLRLLSQKSGMHIVTNTGYYGAVNNLYLPRIFYDMTAEGLAQIWVDEMKNGIEGSGVRPGFIKIGVAGNDTLSEEHLKIITAAALAHQKTGLVIASHTGPELPALAQIEVLQTMDIDPSAFIWVHAQLGSLEGNLKAARKGAWISLDNLSTDREPGSTYDVDWYAERILALKDAGVLDHILISHDAGWYNPGVEDGGNFRGFTGIFTDLLPALEKRDFSRKDIKQLMEINPRNAFALRNQESH